jgi:hypothetical protein
VNGNGDYLDFRRWRNIVSYLAGMGVETLFTVALAGIAALILAGFWIFSR